MTALDYDAALARAGDRAAERRRDRHRPRKDYKNTHARAHSLGRHAPFCGVDGEGGGHDKHGRQHFLLLRAGEFELFRGNKPLSTKDCLDFILSLPPKRIYVGYFFGYDTTMILRDLDTKTVSRLFDERRGYVRWRSGGATYGIDYRPRQYLRIARIDPKSRRPIAGSSRTIDEVGGFFQTSFVNVLKNWAKDIDLAGDDLAAVEAGKAGRGQFERMTRKIRRYCETECDLLARVMTAFRQTCLDANIVPRSWRGAGWIAGELHRQHGTPKRPGDERNPEFEAFANRGYYGGRFEITRAGSIASPVHEYDINSAYPAAMRLLPCPLHTTWRLAPNCMGLDDRSLYVAEISYRHVSGETCSLAGLPHRAKGRLKWPLAGRGVYWSPEIESAKRLGMRIAGWHGGYVAERSCDCRPYDWVGELYGVRQSLGKSTRGYPLKLGLNGAYGKLAQRVGAATYRDVAAAGLTTAIVRGWLNDAVALDPKAIVMLATDAVYSTRPLALPIGNGLGQWETKTCHAGIFIVQPGIYWPNGAADRIMSRPRTRGVPIGPLLEHCAEFEDAWREFLKDARDIKDKTALSMVAGPPSFEVSVDCFIGLRLGLHRRNPFDAGKWTSDYKKNIRFSWFNKRRFDNWQIDGSQVLTSPYAGAIDHESEGYKSAGDDEDVLERSLLDEAAPDYPQWSAIDATLAEHR